MKLDRRSFLAAAAAALAAPVALAQSAEKTKFTVILDWFVNPDHAPLFTARYIGAFDRAGLDVVLVVFTWNLINSRQGRTHQRSNLRFSPALTTGGTRSRLGSYPSFGSATLASQFS